MTAPDAAGVEAAVTSLLSKILTAFEQAASYVDVLSRMCRILCEALPCDRVTVYVLSRRRDVFVPAADHGSPADVRERFVARAFGPGSFPGDALVRTGEVVWGQRGATPSLVESVLDDARVFALAIVPIALAGILEGVITFAREAAPGFLPRDIAVFRGLARHLGVLLRSLRLETEAVRLVDRRTRLAQWGAEVLATGAITGMAERLDAAGRDLFRATGAWLLVVDDGALRGVGDDDLTGTRLPLDGSSAAATALRRRDVLVVNRYRESSHVSPGRTGAPEALIAAPLVDEHGDLGVLLIHDQTNPFRFGHTDHEDAKLLATLATAALRKGLLVQAVTRASAAKDEFLASVSHDLRTPLNVIVGYTQLLEEETFGPLTPGQRDTLGRLLRTATEQLHLIDDLLDLARIEQGKLACRLEPVRLVTLLPSLESMMAALLHERPVRFAVAVPDDVVVHTDAERLRQVLVNLLTNAAKFTPEGSVTLRAARAADRVCIEIVDTGPGIPAELRAHVLEPFVRGSQGAVGSGLGLAIVARLVRALEGQLAIDVAAGTTVRLDLPAA